MEESIRLTQGSYACHCAENFNILRPGGPPGHALVHFLRPMLVNVHGEMRKVAEGAFILYEKGRYQQYRPQTKDMLEHWCHFEMCGFAAFAQELGLPLGEPFFVQDAALIDGLLKSVLEEFLLRGADAERTISLGMRALLFALAASYQKPDSLGGAEERLEQLRLCMSMHLDENWPLKRMADELSFSIPHFSMLYKKRFGVSPKHDLNRMRLERAKYLLTTTSYSVEHIAELLHYASPTTFIAQFRSGVGMPPGKYRRSI